MSTQKILLVNPLFDPTFWGFQRALSFEKKRCAFPPLGLLTVSGLLPKDCQRKLVDCNVTPLTDVDINWADLVFVTGMLVQKKYIHQIIDRCKAMGKTVAIGGPYVSTSTEEVPQADYIFVGEAEETLPQFFQDLERGKTKPIYKAAERPTMAISPKPDFTLVNPKNYGAMSVQFSRGCPFSCEFCDIIEIYGRVPRTKSNQQLMLELDALKATGYQGSLFIVDDNFIGNKKNVRLLMPDLIEWQRKNGFPFSLFTEASLNLAEDEKLLQEMQDAGFRRVFLGIETPVEASLKETQKLQNTRRSLLESVRIIQEYGIEVMAGFIVGFDNDPVDIFKRQIEFITDSGIPLAMVGMLTALPDTQLWRRMEKEGRLLNEGSGSNAEDLNFIPTMGAETLIAGFHEVLRAIYAPRAYYQRSLNCLSRLPANLAEPTKYGLVRAIKILARVFLRLGILDQNRWEFWRYMGQVVLHHRSQFAQGLRLAIMGYHFTQLVPQTAGPTD